MSYESSLAKRVEKVERELSTLTRFLQDSGFYDAVLAMQAGKQVKLEIRDNGNGRKAFKGKA